MLRLLLVAVLFQAPIFAQTFRGPLPVENLRPFQGAFLHFSPESPDALPQRRTRIGVQFDTANNLLIPDTTNGASVEEDHEVQRLRLSYRRGLGRKLELGADAQLVARNGGILDAPIDFYHDLLGLGGDGEDNPEGRDARSNGRSVLRFQDANGRGVNEGSAFGLGDTTLSLKRQLSDGRFASSARVALKLPTGSGSKVLGSGGTDFGANVDARYALSRRVALFGSLGALRFGDGDIPNARRSGVQGGLGLEYRGRRGSFLAQTDAQTRTVTTGNRFADRTPIVVSVGYKRPIGDNKLFWASFSENGDYHNFNAPFFGNIGPDFTLSVGFEVRR